MKFVREALGEMRWEQKIQIAGNVWVGKINPTSGLTCKRGDSGLTFVYRDVSKVCILLLCISLLIDFCSQSWCAPVASDMIQRGVRACNVCG